MKTPVTQRGVVHRGVIVWWTVSVSYEVANSPKFFKSSELELFSSFMDCFFRNMENWYEGGKRKRRRVRGGELVFMALAPQRDAPRIEPITFRPVQRHLLLNLFHVMASPTCIILLSIYSIALNISQLGVIFNLQRYK